MALLLFFSIGIFFVVKKVYWQYRQYWQYCAKSNRTCCFSCCHYGLTVLTSTTDAYISLFSISLWWNFYVTIFHCSLEFGFSEVTTEIRIVGWKVVSNPKWQPQLLTFSDLSVFFRHWSVLRVTKKLYQQHCAMSTGYFCATNYHAVCHCMQVRANNANDNRHVYLASPTYEWNVANSNEYKLSGDHAFAVAAPKLWNKLPPVEALSWTWLVSVEAQKIFFLISSSAVMFIVSNFKLQPKAYFCLQDIQCTIVDNKVRLKIFAGKSNIWHFCLEKKGTLHLSSFSDIPRMSSYSLVPKKRKKMNQWRVPAPIWCTLHDLEPAQH